jgi:hypothetical protein
MPEQRSEYKLSPAGQMVMAILNRAGSGYGREQLLLVALRLACMELEGWTSPKRTVGTLLLHFLAEAEAFLEGDPDA